jgi:hypothetical protein
MSLHFKSDNFSLALKKILVLSVNLDFQPVLSVTIKVSLEG